MTAEPCGLRHVRARSPTPTTPCSRHLLDIGVWPRRHHRGTADAFVEVASRAIPKVPALRGRTVATLFFEDSTRTRVSFETAAKRLSADVLSFSAGSSSLKKGESLRDTVETIEAMGIDAIIVRHRRRGCPTAVAGWVADTVVVNAGDGWHEHPTQALLDCTPCARCCEAAATPGVGPLRGLAGGRRR